MPNNYFKFRQFTVQQDKCAMKVCTDACLFGALLPPGPLKGKFRALDIGAGTGLLSLMYAQKYPHAIIDAVEIDRSAAEQANENFAASPWTNRLTTFNTDVLKFNTHQKYDLIISNPPFFEDDLRSPDQSRNDAKHDTALSLTDLVRVAGHFLAEKGILAVLLPSHRVNYFIEEAVVTGLHLNKQVLVRQTTGHGSFRGILFFSRTRQEPVRIEMSIKDDEGSYTPEFISVLKDYYLYL